ncbi:AMP-dependent synthetase/ligase domain-containing protein [Vibrio crassostreae]|nr:AMP-dependent synthetase/ligase domain-containing protein [Vibrio crassostreae]CAK2774102.1 AMP-dependent synthetase/ligase domain-containing protein [Vibrio crassostreae]CAK3217985.1 AMP-dependent synthetase/ligase domain-containing protein [Vibrio crassostreae]CAK3841543.1 AMP-dependent synthetase/ligase domain-containing protein [Vibrio crassostreae]
MSTLCDLATQDNFYRCLTNQQSSSLKKQLDRLELRPGNRIALCLDNSLMSAALLLMLIERSVSVLVLPSDSTKEEQVEYLCRIEGDGFLSLQDDRICLSLAEVTQRRADTNEVGLFMLTSGSTGKPKAVFRSVRSWQHEAQRYLTLLRLNRQHKVLLAAPLYHAYSLGWLWAVYQSGAELAVLPPTHFSAIKQRMAHWASHVALTPNIAKLLAMRKDELVDNSSLQVVMAGAGPVSDILDELFCQAFNIRLSRNYGSTESGALFAGLAPQPAYSIGTPMPNIHIQATSAPGREFPLVVRMEDGQLYETNDIVSAEEGYFRVVGRETSAIRRGERWVSPFEIEGVLQQYFALDDCYVRGVQTTTHGNDQIVASVVFKRGSETSARCLRAFCNEKLSKHKVPDVIDIVDAIERGSHGKPMAAKRYSCAEHQSLIDIASAYKRSHLLFSLYESGVLNSLAIGASVDQVALQLGIKPSELEVILQIAEKNKIVAVAEDRSLSRPEGLHQDVVNVIELEKYNHLNFNTTAELTQLITKGREFRRFTQNEVTDKFINIYQSAMSGGHKSLSLRLVARKIHHRQAGCFHVLDISATTGMYSTHFIDLGICEPNNTYLLPVGSINGEFGKCQRIDGVEQLNVAIPEHSIDIIVMDNVVHSCKVSRNIEKILKLLKEDGVLVVDDLFLTATSSAIGVDWLTHGEVKLLDESELLELFTKEGFLYEYIVGSDSTKDMHKVFFFNRTKRV